MTSSIDDREIAVTDLDDSVSSFLSRYGIDNPDDSAECANSKTKPLVNDGNPIGPSGQPGQHGEIDAPEPSADTSPKAMHPRTSSDILREQSTVRELRQFSNAFSQTVRRDRKTRKTLAEATRWSMLAAATIVFSTVFALLSSEFGSLFWTQGLVILTMGIGCTLKSTLLVLRVRAKESTDCVNGFN